MDLIFGIPSPPASFIMEIAVVPFGFIFSIPNTVVEVVEAGDVLIKDQDENILETITAPGEYHVQVLDEIVDTIDNNESTIIIVPLV